MFFVFCILVWPHQYQPIDEDLPLIYIHTAGVGRATKVQLTAQQCATVPSWPEPNLHWAPPVIDGVQHYTQPPGVTTATKSVDIKAVVDQAHVTNFQLLLAMLQLGVWMKVRDEELPEAPPAVENIIQKCWAGQFFVELQLVHCGGNYRLALPQLFHQMAQFGLQFQKVCWQEKVAHKDAGTMQMKQLQQ